MGEMEFDPKIIREKKRCRTCGSSRLSVVIDLGRTPLANDFIAPEKVSSYSTFLPLRLCVCRDCSLAQLADIVSAEVLYSSYAYVTSTSKTMEIHLKDQCRHLIEVTGMSSPRVLEIASNTGVYLKEYQARGCQVLGIEPARNISEIAVRNGIPTWSEFFDSGMARDIARKWGRADLIVGRHVFAHIDDLQDLLIGLERIASRETVIAFEVPYVVEFFNKIEFDTIYHEHLSYISARAIMALLKETPFFLQRIDNYPIHGGSILFHLRLRASKVPTHSSVHEALSVEDQLRLWDPDSWKPFVEAVQYIRVELPRLVRNLKASGKRVIGYGASAKGNTLLNCCGLTSKDLEYIIDNTPFKQGKVSPGSWLPIEPPEQLLKERPDYALLLAWNFAEEIIKRETEYQRGGGRFILPIPEPRIVKFPG